MCHGLDLVNVARALIIASDLIAPIRVPLRVAGHKIGVLDGAYRWALGIFAGNKIDRLPTAPLILGVDNGANIGNIHRHGVILLCVWRSPVLPSSVGETF